MSIVYSNLQCFNVSLYNGLSTELEIRKHFCTRTRSLLSKAEKNMPQKFSNAFQIIEISEEFNTFSLIMLKMALSKQNPKILLTLDPIQGSILSEF